MKSFLITIILFIGVSVKSQEISALTIKKVITESFPEIDFSNKLLAICVWNSQDASSREQNKEFNRTWETYKHARLKGGLKGVVFISISSDDNKMNLDIATQKDGLTNEYSICDFKGYETKGKLNSMDLKSNTKNIVFDNNGELIYNNLSTETIFKSFNSLITR